jgi:hypothetical protein
MAETRTEVKLTEEQQTILKNFEDIIAHPDQAKLVEIIYLLDCIPKEFSPIKALALKDDFKTIELFISAAKEKIKIQAAKTLAKKMSEKLTAFNEGIDQFMKDGTISKFDAININEAVTTSIRITFELLEPIYYDAILSYASRGMVSRVDALLSSRETLGNGYGYELPAYIGYEQGGFSKEMEALWDRGFGVNVDRKTGVPADKIKIVSIFIKNLAQQGRVADVAKTLMKFQLIKNSVKEYADAVSEGYKLCGLHLESKKIITIYNFFTQVKKRYQEDFEKYDVTGDYIPQGLISLINKLGLEDLDVKISLLVDCLYKKTFLGAEFWATQRERHFFWEYYEDVEPTLKVGALNKVIEQLKTLGVDIAKLPGFAASYSPGFFTTYPSKQELENLLPPSIIPMLGVAVRHDISAAVKLIESSDQMFKL